MGGTLNPLLAFLSLIALLTTIKIQSKELRATTTEMNNSSTALQEQSQSIKLQNFENTFFKMIDVHNSIISEFKHQRNSIKLALDKLTEENKKNTQTNFELFLKVHAIYLYFITSYLTNKYIIALVQQLLTIKEIDGFF